MADGSFAGWLTHRLGRLPGAKAAARAQARLYIRSKGRLGGRWFGLPVLVLEIRGRKTGIVRTTPLIYLVDGDTPVVVAANGGADRTPSWWLNLRAAGRGTVYIKGERRHVRPRELSGAQRDAFLRRLERAFPSMRHYSRYTPRRFPVIALDRIPDPAD